MEKVENFDLKNMVIMEEKEEDECSVYQSIICEEQGFDPKNLPLQTQCQLTIHLNYFKVLAKLRICLKHLNELFSVINPQNEKLLKKVLDTLNIIALLELQFSMVMDYLLEPTKIEEIKEKYDKLGSSRILINEIEELSNSVFSLLYIYLNEKTLLELENTIKSMTKKLKESNWLRYFNELKIILSKLVTINEFLPNALNFDRNDLFSLDRGNQRWKKLEPVLIHKSLGDPVKITKDFNKIVRYILFANALLAKKQEQTSALSQNLVLGFGAIYYFFLTSKASKKANIFYADPHQPTAQKIWNLPDTSIIKSFFKLMMPSIEYNKKIFVERDTVPSIKSENILNEINENTINKKTNDWIVMRSTILYPDIYYENLFKEDINRIPLRILSSKKLTPLPNLKKPSIIQELFNKLSPRKKSSKPENNEIKNQKISNVVINEYSSQKNTGVARTEEIKEAHNSLELIDKTCHLETKNLNKEKEVELDTFDENHKFFNDQENFIQAKEKPCEEKQASCDKKIDEFETFKNNEEIIIENDFFQKPDLQNVCEEVKTVNNEKKMGESFRISNAPKIVSAQGSVIILHIHGGGFIGMSSRSHQSYTRKWATMLGIPIFSIDYRLAPEFPYPAALDDCWQAYHWLRNNAEEMFGILPKKIIVVGDSAGGNLAAALTVKAIKSSCPPPSGLVLAYPALSLVPWKFTPSFLLSLDDQILPHMFLKLCIKAYLNEGPHCSPEKDPLLSPGLVSDEILREFPPTRILVGTKDPLHDDSIRFTDRLNNLNVNVKTIIYDEMPHGFLNYDAPQGMPEAKTCVEDAANCIKELINI